MNIEKNKKESVTLTQDITANKTFSLLDSNKNPFITDISLSRSFLTKRNTAFNKKEALKQFCIHPKEIIQNVNESYEFMKQNPNPPLINSIKNNKLIATITRFNEYKERSKKMAITSRPIIYKQNKINQFSFDYVKGRKIKEMSILFSKTSVQNENEMLTNIIREMKFFFPQKFEECHEYFKYNSFIINSENKQVQLFIIILELIIDILKDLASPNDIYLQMLNALFEDFRLHISNNSLNRADFLGKIWSLQQEFVEEKVNKFKSDLNDISIRYECINDENFKLKERVKAMEKELSSKQTEMLLLSKENAKMKTVQTEKEQKLSDAAQFIKELSSELKNKTNAYNDLIIRFNLRVNPSKFTIMNTERDNSSVYNESVASNNQSYSVNIHSTLNKTSKMVQFQQQGDDSSNTNINANVNPHSNQKKYSSKFANNLKSKIKETNYIISENRKKQTELNLFATNFDVIEQYQDENNKDAFENKTNKLELYMNKGMNVNDERIINASTQTDISGIVEDIDSENCIKTIQAQIKDTNLVSKMQKIFGEYDLVFKENSLLKNKIENIEENNERIIETYTNIFQTFIERMKTSNTQIKTFVSDNMNKIKGQQWIGDFLQNIERLNQETVADNTISPIYDFISKPELIQIHQDIKEIDPQSPKDIGSNDTSSAVLLTTNFESISKEFLEQFNNLKLSITLKKTIKIINAIYFEMIESVYFKHDRLHFDIEDRFIELGEVVFLFFIKNFGLEKLARKKTLDFLKALIEYELQSKRISNFIKLLQIKRDSVKRGRERRASLGGQSNFVKYLTTFILRQILLMIQFLKVNSFFIKQYNEELNTSRLVLLYPKLYESLLTHFEKMNLSQEMKNQLFNFIEKNKFSISQNLNQVVDFDDLFEKVSEIFIQYELGYNKTLRSLFNSVDIESTGEIDFIDCLVLQEYVCSHKLNYNTIESLFHSLKNSKHKLTFEYFETFAIETDSFDMDRYKEFINTKGVDCKVLLKNLKAELKGNQVVIFDHFITRLNSSNIKNVNMFLEKIKALKKKIIALHKEEFEIEHFISIKLLDKVSLFLFNENKVNTIFNKLEFIYTLIDESKPENENYLWTHIKKNNLIKI